MTTIAVQEKTRAKLESQKVMERETFDAVIWRLINNQEHRITK